MIELTVATFVFSIAVAVLAQMFILFVNNYAFSFEQNLTISEVKVAFAEIRSELREIRTSENGAHPLFVANDHEIGFYADIDDDGRIERVRYYLSGTDFFKAVLEPNDTQDKYSGSEEVRLISDIVVNQDNPIFYYYDGNWPGDTTNNPLTAGDRLLNTRMVEAEVEINTATGQQQNFVVSTKTMLRNLKTNY